MTFDKGDLYLLPYLITDLDLYPVRDPAPFFLAFFQDAKKISFLRFSCLLLTVGTFTQVFKDSKKMRSHKTVEMFI